MAVLAASVVGCGSDQGRVITHRTVIDRGNGLPHEQRPPQDGTSMRHGAGELTQQAGAAQYGDFLLTKTEISRSYQTPVVLGTLLNSSNRDYSFVQITMQCFDEKGKLLETVTSNKAGLKAGKAWRFSVPVKRSKGLERVQVQNVIGW